MKSPITLTLSLLASVILSVSNAAAEFTNGDFEQGTLTGWIVTTNSNPGVTLATPPENTSRSDLNLTSGGVDNTSVVTATTETGIDANLGSGESLRYPKYGSYAAVVNLDGSSTNTNVMTQTMTTSVVDVDPSDGKVHVRFVVAPVVNNPSHSANQQPYYFVQVRNVTSNTVLYSTFKYANQPGVPWISASGNYQYTEWQLFDIAPGNAALPVGDQVELTIIAARCSLGGHAGYVYVDGVGAFIPGLSISAIGPDAANDGMDITYYFDYRNGGTSATTNSTATIVLPTNTTFVSVSGATCTTPSVGSAGTVTCNVGTVSPNASGTFSVTAKIDPSTTGTISLGNYSISADSVSALLGPLVQTAVTSGVVYADLDIENTNGAAAAGWGQALQYTITVSNNGPNTATNASVTETFPAQLTGITWTCAASAGASCTASGSGNLNDTVTIPNGGSIVYTVNASVIAGSGTATLTSTATVSSGSGQDDHYSFSDSATDTDAIGTLRDVTVTKNTLLGGTVLSSPSAINCGNGCGAQVKQFVDGASVSLTAIPEAGYVFIGWGGACTGTGSCLFTVGSSSTVTASFSKASCTSGNYGPDCAQCPGSGNCSGHGTCDDGVNGTGACTCESGYGGSACTVSATPTPTPPPVATTEIRGRILSNGNPLSGVVVDGGPLGIAITDEDGNFVFTGVPAGTTTTITPRLSGYDFTPISLSSGGYGVISGSTASFNRGDCDSKITAGTLLKVSVNAKKLRDLGIRIGERGKRWLRRIPLSQLDLESKARFEQRIVRDQNKVSDYFLKINKTQRSLPDEVLQCPRQSTCSELSIVPYIGRIKALLIKMKNTEILLSTKISTAKLQNDLRLRVHGRKSARHYNRVVRELEQFPKKTGVCS